MEEYVKEGEEKIQIGDVSGFGNVPFGWGYTRGMGDGYLGGNVGNERIRLEFEDVDVVVRKLVRGLEGGR